MKRKNNKLLVNKKKMGHTFNKNEEIKRQLTCLKFNLDFMRKYEREIT